MQEGEFNYYELEYNSGCCLKCSESHEGCLCYNCKCKKCYWYTPPEENDGEKGICDLVEELKRERKEKFLEELRIKELIKEKQSELLKRDNKKVLAKTKEKGLTPSYYTCQKCKRTFIHPNELKIERRKTPLCKICSNKIIVTEKNLND